MARGIGQSLDFGNTSRLLNIPNPILGSEPATKGYVDSAVEGISWKASAKVATQSNINLSTPSANIDGITLTLGNRILVRSQTLLTENGIYLFDTGSTPLVRSADANTFQELEQAVISIEEGTDANTSYRQTQINGVINTNNVIWSNFGTNTPNASEVTAGKAEIATQAETNTGTDDLRIVTPLKLTNWVGKLNRFTSIIGDGTATSFTLTHNLGTRDLHIAVFLNSGNYDEVLTEIQRPTINTVVVVFASAPSTNQFKVVILG